YEEFVPAFAAQSALRAAMLSHRSDMYLWFRGIRVKRRNRTPRRELTRALRIRALRFEKGKS
ncbi:hypothetical protein ACFU5I_41305, partial [Streptomyces libani]|uniref:hypothetical protein n=1 Tax=Streptomyces nigrescens TaxID=1920 RepID=UPI0036BAD61F